MLAWKGGMSEEAGTRLNPRVVCAMLGSRVRWAVMKIMADGTPRIAVELARTLGMGLNNVAKHMRLLRDAGLLEAYYDEADKRYLTYRVAERHRRTPGVLDFGCCRVEVK